MTHWLFPANIKYYDVMTAMSQPHTYWPMHAKVEVGDVVYLYLAAPHKQIAFICEVTDIELSYDKVIDEIRTFLSEGSGDKKSDKPFIQLSHIKPVVLEKESKLGLSYLKEHGLNGMLMGPRKLENNPSLLSYIHGEIS